MMTGTLANSHIIVIITTIIRIIIVIEICTHMLSYSS